MTATATSNHTNNHHDHSASFGTTLRTLRQEKHLSQSELAKATGVLSQPLVSRLEMGKDLPSSGELKVLADRLAPTPKEAAAVMTQLEDLTARARAAQAEAEKQRRPAAATTMLGKKIVELRTTQKLSRRALAKKAKLHPNHLALIEYGRVKHPAPKTLQALEKVLRCGDALRKADAMPQGELALESRPETAPHSDEAPHQPHEKPTWARLPGLFYAADVAGMVQLKPDGSSYFCFRRTTTDDAGKQLYTVWRA